MEELFNSATQSFEEVATKAVDKVLPASAVNTVATVATTAKTAVASKSLSLAELLSVLVLVANAVLTLTPKNK